MKTIVETINQPESSINFVPDINFVPGKTSLLRSKAQGRTIGEWSVIGAIAVSLLVPTIAVSTRKIVYILAPQIVTYITIEAMESLRFE